MKVYCPHCGGVQEWSAPPEVVSSAAGDLIASHLPERETRLERIVKTVVRSVPPTKEDSGMDSPSLYAHHILTVARFLCAELDREELLSGKDAERSS